MKKVFLVLLSFVLLAGCASMNQIGEIGTHEIWQVKTRDVISPSTTTVFVHNKEDGALTKVEGGTGRSGLGQIAGPAAVVGAAYFIGRGLEGSGDEINSETNIKQEGSSAAAGSIATGGNADSSATGGNSSSSSISNAASISVSEAVSESISSSSAEAIGGGGGWIPPGQRGR